ncbi:MAG: NAD(P)-dependent glycerol-3-phosphate dehydrogenase [Planctomycetaceae bacterium]|nr:NAD(P)-dependent glycerol-3-phosphate dehydrogenase [Planctomycetaceae bacterium]
MSERIAIFGGGAFGTACAVLLAGQGGHAVHLWVRRHDEASEIAALRENRRLLPGVMLPDLVTVTADVAWAARDATLAVLAIPSKFLCEALPPLREHLPPDLPIVSGVKGLEPQKFRRPSEIITDCLGKRPVIALGGPAHAEEFVRRKPTSVVAAGPEPIARRVQDTFSTDRFRVYTNTDLVGVELAGALKNVVGIAAGICDGLEYGDNAKSALLTRAIVEMTRFGEAYGADPATFQGLAGIGDLITTCVSPYGRNRRVGERLGRGESLEQILADMSAVAEGVTTARSIDALARRKGIDMPITREIVAVLFEGKRPEAATDALMLRPSKAEG